MIWSPWGDALDPSLWKVPNEDLSLSLSLALALSQTLCSLWKVSSKDLSLSLARSLSLSLTLYQGIQDQGCADGKERGAKKGADSSIDNSVRFGRQGVCGWSLGRSKPQTLIQQAILCLSQREIDVYWYSIQ